MNRRAIVVLSILAIPAFTVGTDFTGVLMLITSIERAFAADITTTQWVLNAFALTFAMGLVTGGRLGDMFGHRRLLAIGLVVFVVSSIGCALAPSIGWLIAARALQGIGAAMIWPCLLGLAAVSVSRKEQGYAIGLMMGVAALGNVLGPVISGVLAGIGEWRLFFGFNIVMGLTSALLILRLLPAAAQRRQDESIDFSGIAVIGLAILALLYALDVGADWGWGSWPVVAMLVASAALFAFFPILESRVKDALVPHVLLRNRQFMLALAANGLLVPAIFLMFLYIPQYLNKVLGWSVLYSSLGTLPSMACISVTSVLAGRFYSRFGPRKLLFIGYGLIVLGTVAAVLLSPADGYMGTLPILLLIGLGAGLSISTAGSAAVGAVNPKRAGLAGGLSFMAHLSLGAIGVAGGTAILFVASSAKLRDGLQAAGIKLSAADQDKLNGGGLSAEQTSEILGRFSTEAGEQITGLLRDAFTTGMNQAYWLALISAVLGLFVVFALNTKKLTHVDH